MVWVMSKLLVTLTILIGLLTAAFLLFRYELGPKAIYHEEVECPGSQWRAIAETLESTGPGNASVNTRVYLKWADSNRIEILGLANDSMWPAGATKVQMKWVHGDLEVIYNGKNAKIDFQAIQCAGITISAQSS